MEEKEYAAKELGGGKKAAAAVLIFVCFLLFGGICFAAGSLLWHQGREVDVSVDTSGETFTESVTFTVSNVLGMDILIDDRKDACAMLQYRQDGEWVDFCEIRFVREDSAAISVKYGGMYAHLAPGMELRYRLHEELLDRMQSGEYRIAIPYISEKAYLEYLQDRAEEIDESLEDEQAHSEEETQTSETESETSAVSDAELEEPQEPEKPEVHIFYKEFMFVSRNDQSSEGNPSVGVEVSIGAE